MSSRQQLFYEGNFNVFISYRRRDSGGHVGRLYDYLAEHFGEDRIFRDIDDIAAGENFVVVTNNQAASCDVLLAVIGQQWLTVSEGETRRLDKEDDPVRKEIAAALERNVLIIPVLVQDTPMPRASDLPAPLAKLAEINAHEISERMWQSDTEALIRRLEEEEQVRLLADAGINVEPQAASTLVAVKSPFFWRRTLVRELNDVDSGSWQKGMIVTPLDIDDRREVYSGRVLRSQPGQAHSIAFEAKASAFRPSKIDIPLWVNSDARVELLIQNQPVETFSITASQNRVPHIQRICADVTDWAQASEVLQLRLNITHQRRHAVTTFLADFAQPEKQPTLRQIWSWPVANRAFLFFALAWGIIVGAAILIIVHVTALGQTFRLYAVMVALLTWLSGVLGLPVVAKIPLRPILRRLYGKSRKHRAMSFAALAVMFLAISVGVGAVTYCLFIRQRYAGLIAQAIAHWETDNYDYLRDAFVLIPWRKEAQYLLEKRAYSLKSLGDTGKFRAYIRRFALEDEAVKRTMDRLNSNNQRPFYLSDDERAFSDPIIWYASILPEGEGIEDKLLKEEAVRRLSSRPDTDRAALFQRLAIELELYQTDEKRREEITNKLTNLVDDPNQEAVVRGFPYQVANDVLAQNDIIKSCRTPESEPNQFRQNAVKRFIEVLNVRTRQPDDKREPLWHRPPDKLMLYHIFRSYGNVTEDAPIRKAKAFLKTCHFKSAFETQLKGPYSQYLEPATWKTGTILNDDLISYTQNTLLERGWEY